MADGNECPIDGCDAGRGAKQLMCKVHWRRVPADTQRKVYAAARKMWRAENADGLGSARWNQAYQAWSDLRDEAVAQVEMRAV